MYSFWEKEELIRSDVSIMGGGLVGLSVAASIKERWPKREVTVFERSIIPFGASTRNAGFACTGSLSEIVDDLDTMGNEDVRDLIFQRWIGLQITLKRLSNIDIEYHRFGGYELISSQDLSCLENIDQINTMVSDFLPDYFKRIPTDPDFGLRAEKGDVLIKINGEGQLNPAKLLVSLEQYCASLGVKFRFGSNIKNIDRQGSKFDITINDQFRNTVNVITNVPIVCTNAFAQHLIENLDIKPGRGQVLITKPIKGLKFKGNLHLDRGYYYLRNVGKRMLIGGGRNEDFAEEESLEMRLNPQIQIKLEDALKGTIVSESPFTIDQRWAGVMAFGKSKLPIVRLESNGILTAVKLSGMGVALAGYIGESVSDIIENNQL